MKKNILTFLLVLWSLQSNAYDFAILLSKCKMTVANANSSDVKTLDGESLELACTRSSRKFNCEFFSDKKKVKDVVYQLDFESAGLFGMKTENFSDYYFIDTKNHSALINIRVFEIGMLGSKVCSGKYFTQSEMASFKPKAESKGD